MRRPLPLPLQVVGMDPGIIVGKVLTRISRSQKHPCMQLHFADDTCYQILVDGYDPVHRGLPKALEMDPNLESLLDGADGQVKVDRTVSHCALITLTDKAFESKQREHRWDQNHTGVAFKFSEDQVWHCVWATLSDHENGTCIFRSYHDVYLDQLHRSSHKRRSRAPSSR
ncbi:hypothetical protein SCLCIDRAFT_104163 [Scleroderma citrinum Foug A]|uniref:Uncharacterized protein n=1 Tax=Scleroderma citrinum Foug A TaxID=1036808 RepID=A0A0C3AW28_9AGAM|nr:hypothetical protein SCLCIDRAFT_104163 [Scleroderma citrinum Foug A]